MDEPSQEKLGNKASVTGRRLALAFAAILLLFGAALVVELVTLGRIGDAEAQVARLDRAKHAGHHAAAMVREQYIHQAHSLIEFDRSHLAHYQEAVAETREATERLEALAESPEEKQLAAEIARLAEQNDRDFETRVVPLLGQGQRGDLRVLGEALESVAERVVHLNEQLNAELEQRAATAGDHAAQLREKAREATLLCFALAIALAAAVGWWLTRSIVRRVSALRAGVRRVGAGDLGARIVLDGDDEFVELAGAFNQMTANLATQQEALLRSQKLASIGQLAAGVAHEINNPLTVILGYSKMLRKQASDGAREELGIIEDEARQCQRIVQGLLDLARPQQLDVGAVDLAELAREAVGRLDDAGALEGRSVQLPPGGAHAEVSGDAGKLRQVIANIVANAAQATSAEQPIVIETSTAEDGAAVLTVADQGPGIPADVLPHVFDPFFTTKRQGTGLGLSIAQAIVDAHGGRLVIDSAPGRGTRVSLRLPRTKAIEERAT
jgi:two-component system, NtrC family, sensor kinase